MADPPTHKMRAFFSYALGSKCANFQQKISSDMSCGNNDRGLSIFALKAVNLFNILDAVRANLNSEFLHF